MQIRKYILSIVFILLVLNGIAGNINLRTFDYSLADSIALNCNQKFNETSDLAYALTKDLKTDHEKFRSIFRWVTNNIAYSYSARKVEPKYVLKTKKAICSGYSNLLQDICNHAMLECEVIVGYAKSGGTSIGEFKETNHAWNAIKLNGDWYLVDATWAAGYVDKRKFIKEFDEYYFLAEPNEFMYRHYPEDPKWFLTETSLKKKEFERMPVRTRDFFSMGIEELKKLKGEVKNKLRYEFKTAEPIYRMSINFKNQKKFIQIEFIEKDGVYLIDLNLKNSPRGYFSLFFNGSQIITLKRK